jgi:hypothetical protein
LARDFGLGDTETLHEGVPGLNNKILGGKEFSQAPQKPSLTMVLVSVVMFRFDRRFGLGSPTVGVGRRRLGGRRDD